MIGDRIAGLPTLLKPDYALSFNPLLGELKALHVGSLRLKHSPQYSKTLEGEEHLPDLVGLAAALLLTLFAPFFGKSSERLRAFLDVGLSQPCLGWGWA